MVYRSFKSPLTITNMQPSDNIHLIQSLTVEKTIPLTVIFTTFNEECNIAQALNSVVGWVSEIIVVDSFSTDNTANIVSQYKNVQFLQHLYFGPAFQKNWAIPLANNEWVLLMDADERIPMSLRNEIESLFKRMPSDKNVHFDCFWIGFTHYFAGKKVKYSGWQNDKTIRLIKRNVCRYKQQKVHEEIYTEGLTVGKLHHTFDHYTYRNIKHFVEKQIRYAEWSAEDKDAQTGNITYYHLFLKPLFRFMKHFILKKGFLDGYIGFIISSIAAWSVFMRYLYMYEKRNVHKL